MDPSSWQYTYNRLQSATGQQPHDLQHVAYAAGSPHLLLHHQIRQAQAVHEAQITSQYQNMGLPPSLVQVAASNKSNLHQQALVNLNMRETAMSGRVGQNVELSVTSRDGFTNNSAILTPPQTPVSNPWKSASTNGVGHSLVVIPEVHKSDIRQPVASRHTSYSLSQTNDSIVNGVGSRRPGTETKATQQPFGENFFITARAAPETKTLSTNYTTPQPPPRQSSQPPQRNSSNNRTAFPGLQPPGHDFREPYQHHSELIIQRQQASPQMVQQPSPQYYNNSSPQNVSSPQGYHFQQNHSPHTNEQYFNQQQQSQTKQRNSSSSRAKSSRSSSSTGSSGRQSVAPLTPKPMHPVQQNHHVHQHDNQHQLILMQQQHQLQQHNSHHQQQPTAHQASHVSRDIGISTQQDLGLARLGALGALTELNENSDLLNDVPSTINYEDLGLGGGSISTQHSGSSRHQNMQNNTPTSHNNGQGLIPQIVMNPWDPSQAPVMTFAPLANAVQAYQQQWLTMQAHQQAAGIQQEEGLTNSSTAAVAVAAAIAAHQDADEPKEVFRQKVICLSPDEELGFLRDLPPPCNVVLQPSTVGLSGKVPVSPYLIAFQKFLKGEECARPKEVLPEIPPELPGKKKYIPPYTPKSALENARNNPGPARLSNNSRSRIQSGARSFGGSRKRRNRNSDDELEVDMTSLPKRETSSRKAKDNSSSRRIIQSKLFEDDEELHGLDLSDSDDDATWTPFKDKNNPERGSDVPQGKNRRFVTHEDLEGFNDEGRRSRKQSNPILQSTTSLVTEGQDFKAGDFVVLKEDAERENAPIWRFDTRTLLQRYNPEQSKSGEYLHKSANLFSGFVPCNRDRYVSVAVKYLVLEGDSYVVKVVNRGIVKMVNPELRLESLSETNQFQENFEVYVQAMISQCLDSKFLEEVFSDQDEYFVSNIEKVDSVTLLRKDKVMRGVRWTLRFQHALGIWPMLNDLGGDVSQEVKCGACENGRASTTLQMFGQPYHPNTLKIIQPDEQTLASRSFFVCYKCCRLAQLYHRLTHQKYRLYNMCAEVVDAKKRPGADTTKILNELLANETWLESQFRRMQELWADADSFVR